MNRIQTILAALALLPAAIACADETVAVEAALGSSEAYEAVVQFYGYDDMPLDARVVERTELPTHIREKVVFNGPRDQRVPGYLGLPKEGKAPFPVILMIDGIMGAKSRWWEEDSWPHGRLATERLIAAGFAVLALDAQYHGERIGANDYESAGVFFFQKEWHHRSRDMFVQSTIEYRRAIDYLETRPDINAEHVGALGLSMGAVIIFGLNASDPRLDVSVAGVTPIGIFEQHQLTVISPFRLARGIQDRPFLMLMGRTDPYYSEEIAQQLFTAVGSDSKELVFYDSDHRLPPEYVDRAVQWFEAHLE